MLWHICGWYRGVIHVPCNVLGQWPVTSLGNDSWCRGAMAGDAFIGWFYRNLWFGAQTVKWLKKTRMITWKIPSYTGQLSNFMWSIIMRVLKNDFILSFHDLRTNGPFLSKLLRKRQKMFEIGNCWTLSDFYLFIHSVIHSFIIYCYLFVLFIFINLFISLRIDSYGRNLRLTNTLMDWPVCHKNIYLWHTKSCNT